MGHSKQSWLIGVMWIACGALAQGAALVTEDVAELGGHLVARRGTLAQGTMDYERTDYIVDTVNYEKCHDAIINSRHRMSEADIVALLASLREYPGTSVIKACAGKWYYDTSKTERWRITYSGRPDLLTPPDIKYKGGVGSPATEDAAFNGDYVLAVRDSECAVYKGKQAAIDYPQLPELDMSLAEWHYMMEKGANPGQRITATTKGDEHILVFGDEGGGSDATSATYVFSAALGYATIRCVTQAHGNIQKEVLSVYSEREGTALPTPTLTVTADFPKGEGKVRVTAWWTRHWQDTVKEEDLQPVLPTKYVMIDERFGKAPLFVSVDNRGEKLTRPLEETDTSSLPNKGRSFAASRSVDDQNSVAPRVAQGTAPKADHVETPGPIKVGVWVWLVAVSFVVALLLLVARAMRHKSMKSQSSVWGR